MPSLGLSLALPRTAGSFYDPDALSYFAAASITDPIGKEQINTFVRGIKSLGLYNNMVAWPLRSTQNAGTGVTAYSLGGLGVYNGALINDPTWGTSGITFGLTKYIATTLTSGFSEFSVFSITTPQSNSNMYEFAKDDGTTTEFSILQQLSTLAVKAVVKNSAGTIVSGPLAYTVSAARGIILRASSSVNKVRKNNESDLSSSTGTLTQASNPVTIGATSLGATSFRDTIHATILFNTALTDAETSAVYALYQTSLGAGLGLPDADASAYIARAGVTDATGQQQINDFVVGVKNLGLYNNMVAWPLRSTQNAGTGTTAYSLGGLGTYDGTLTYGPTWGTSGITFDGTDDYIETGFASGLSEFSIFSVTTSNSTGVRYEYSKDFVTSNREFGVFQQTNGITNFFVRNSSGLIQTPAGAYTTDCKLHCFRASSSVNKLRRNNGSDVTGTTGTLTQGTTSLRFGALAALVPISFFRGSISSIILFNKALTDSETSSMYALYHSTLGAGLGLPDPSQTFYRDFATNKTLNHGTGPNISFVRASAANYFNSAGVLTSAAVNEPRFDHDPVTLESKGLLVEVQRTNLVERSQEFDNAYWTKSLGGTGSAPVVTANAATAPDGTTTADQIVFNRGAGNTGSDWSQLKRDITISVAGDYTQTIWLKAATGPDVGKQVAIRNVAGAAYLVVTLTADWVRYTRTENTTTLGAKTFDLINRGTYSADNTVSVLAWGAQLEAGSFASSYIGTAGAAVTRASDLPIVTPISSFYNQAEGTIFVQQSQVAIGLNFRFFEISNSDASFRKPLLAIGASNTTSFTTLGGTTNGVSGSGNTVSANTVYKVACAYKTNDFRGALNGIIQNADTTVDVATPVVDRMTIGYSTSIPSFQISCHIQKVEYYNTRLTDAQMQSLTT